MACLLIHRLGQFIRKLLNFFVKKYTFFKAFFPKQQRDSWRLRFFHPKALGKAPSNDLDCCGK